MITVTCGSCHGKINVPDEGAGRKFACPKCGAVIAVPASSAVQRGNTPGQSWSRPAGDTPFVRPAGNQEGGEIPLADEPANAVKKPASRPMPPSTPHGLVIMPMQDVSVVDFQNTRILDAPVIEAIGRELYTLVDEQARRKIVLDFSKVQFMSSQMLGVIVNLYKKSAAIKGKVVLCGLRRDLLKIFSIMKIDKLMKIVDTEQDALDAVGYRGG